MAKAEICGVIVYHGGVPIACGWPPDHLPGTPHSWSSLPTVDCAAEGDEPSYTLGEYAALTGSKIVFVPVEED